MVNTKYVKETNGAILYLFSCLPENEINLFYRGNI